MMNKIKWLRILNLFLLASALLEAFTGIVLFFEFNFYLRQVLIIHRWNGLVMITLVVLHLLFNWGWIRQNYFKKSVVPK